MSLLREALIGLPVICNSKTESHPNVTERTVLCIQEQILRTNPHADRKHAALGRDNTNIITRVGANKRPRMTDTVRPTTKHKLSSGREQNPRTNCCSGTGAVDFGSRAGAAVSSHNLTKCRISLITLERIHRMDRRAIGERGDGTAPGIRLPGPPNRRRSGGVPDATYVLGDECWSGRFALICFQIV